MFCIKNFGKFAQLSLFCSLLLQLTACTPTFNWREVRLESPTGALKASLPCKPDKATRQQQLGDIQVKLTMMGCAVNETTFTLSHIFLSNPTEAPKVLAAWKAAGLASVRVKPAGTIEIPTTVLGASAWLPAVMQTIDGEVAQAHLQWFAKQTANGIVVYQAAMYRKKLSYESSKDAATTLFESLQLQ